MSGHPEIGRFQLSASQYGVYVLDTITGALWCWDVLSKWGYLGAPPYPRQSEPAGSDAGPGTPDQAGNQ